MRWVGHGPRALFDGPIVRVSGCRPLERHRRARLRATGARPPLTRAKRSCAREPRARVQTERRDRALGPLLRTLPGEFPLLAAIPRVRRLSGGAFPDRFGRNHLPPRRCRSRRRAVDRAAVEPTRRAWSAARVQAEAPPDPARLPHRRRRLASRARRRSREPTKLRSGRARSAPSRHSRRRSFLGRTSASGSRSGAAETRLSRRNLPARCSRCRSLLDLYLAAVSAIFALILCDDSS